MEALNTAQRLQELVCLQSHPLANRASFLSAVNRFTVELRQASAGLRDFSDPHCPFSLSIGSKTLLDAAFIVSDETSFEQRVLFCQLLIRLQRLSLKSALNQLLLSESPKHHAIALELAWREGVLTHIPESVLQQIDTTDYSDYRALLTGQTLSWQANDKQDILTACEEILARYSLTHPLAQLFFLTCSNDDIQRIANTWSKSHSPQDIAHLFMLAGLTKQLPLIYQLLCEEPNNELINTFMNCYGEHVETLFTQEQLTEAWLAPDTLGDLQEQLSTQWPTFCEQVDFGNRLLAGKDIYTHPLKDYQFDAITPYLVAQLFNLMHKKESHIVHPLSLGVTWQ
ncbi:hypothetical protein [Pseudoalteromonas ruthenica]|uniref:hypothetical protein n=1 Tax=Pseudoalteromonas ruthenica TaxID=151081 RepID=UPI00110AC73A|nr:hypothetical protein [Pseudoalteromonas ruthenica]TMO47878.1 hypothetical protein CWC24_07005 [Pseudoalteromonas ruthenica]TMO52779.1 hypothetical protein CWC23_01900 [Pseudoalteromonas ruthenica]